MKIERETDREYRRWSVEIHPWVEKSLVAMLSPLIAGGTWLAIATGLARIFGQ